MDEHIKDAKERFQEVYDHLNEELLKLRTGRAQSSLIEEIKVEVYGALTPINQLANISNPEAKVLVVEPWDKSIIKDIEKGLQNGNIGMQVVNEGDKVRLIMPDMTEENRLDVVKVLKQKLEDAKSRIRSVREDIRKELKQLQKDSKISEDELFKLEDILQAEVKIANDKIKEMGEQKEKDIMTI